MKSGLLPTHVMPWSSILFLHVWCPGFPLSDSIRQHLFTAKIITNLYIHKDHYEKAKGYLPRTGVNRFIHFLLYKSVKVLHRQRVKIIKDKSSVKKKCPNALVMRLLLKLFYKDVLVVTQNDDCLALELLASHGDGAWRQMVTVCDATRRRRVTQNGDVMWRHTATAREAKSWWCVTSLSDGVWRHTITVCDAWRRCVQRWWCFFIEAMWSDSVISSLWQNQGFIKATFVLNKCTLCNILFVITYMCVGTYKL
jgi:hypothetical protein